MTTTKNELKGIAKNQSRIQGVVVSGRGEKTLEKT